MLKVLSRGSQGIKEVYHIVLRDFVLVEKGGTRKVSELHIRKCWKLTKDNTYKSHKFNLTKCLRNWEDYLKELSSIVFIIINTAMIDG